MNSAYVILNDYLSSGERYWYIEDQGTGDIVCTDDGDPVHFSSFDEAQEYINTFEED